MHGVALVLLLIRFEYRFENITLNARSCSIDYCVIDFICVCAYFCDFGSGVTPGPVATYTGQ